MTKKIKEQLKNLKNEDVLSTRQSWVLENKQLLMSQISKTRSDVSTEKQKQTWGNQWKNFSHIYQMFLPTNINKSFRSVFTALLALVLTSGGWVASAYAEPGDFMWSTKVAINSVVEQGKLALSSEEQKTSLKLNFAAKSAQVLKQVADSDISNKDTKNKLLKENSVDLQNKLNSANESLKNSEAKDAVNLVKEVSLKTKEISHTLKEVADQISITDDASLSNDLSIQALDASKQSLQMVEVVLEKKAEVNSEVSEEEKLIIREHIADTVNQMQQDTQKAQAQAGQLVEDVKNDNINDTNNPVNVLGQNSSSTAIVLVTNTASTTEIVSTTNPDDISKIVPTEDEVNATKDTKTTAGDLLTKVDAVVKTVETENTNVQTLLDTNVLEAVKKTIELKNTVSDVSKEVSNTLIQLPQKVITTIETSTNTTTTIIATSTSSTVSR
ncbi:MAG: hypothetical protein WC025_00235 [Candidatus Magasanikbacteria bacterium]